jgi:hypothetical protein
MKTLTKNQVETIVKDQEVKTNRPFYIVPVFNTPLNSTEIEGQQYWGLSEREFSVYCKMQKTFLFFRNFQDVKEVNKIINI